ncbi:unnamed protein product [Ambrosiozyma monospora]|uniref:Unnamed protein product n=1 Tax=Ambrosiozyma monospora TaxID=43982 RepID=A0A9W6Z2V4_AMBMO|nr:unnamed protein product [Ambrosiozyma monospora]
MRGLKICAKSVLNTRFTNDFIKVLEINSDDITNTNFSQMSNLEVLNLKSKTIDYLTLKALPFESKIHFLSILGTVNSHENKKIILPRSLISFECPPTELKHYDSGSCSHLTLLQVYIGSMKENITTKDPCWSYLPKQIKKIEITRDSVDPTLSFGINLGNIYKSIEIYTCLNNFTSSHFAVNVKQRLAKKIEKIAKSRSNSVQFVYITSSPATTINILNPCFEVVFSDTAKANILTYSLNHVPSQSSDFEIWNKRHHWSKSLTATPIVDEFAWGLKGSGLNIRCSY